VYNWKKILEKKKNSLRHPFYFLHEDEVLLMVEFLFVLIAVISSIN